MNWLRPDTSHLRSDPDGYMIARYGTGSTIGYIATRLGTQRGKTWENSRHVACERGIDPHDDAARRAAIERLKKECEDDAKRRVA